MVSDSLFLQLHVFALPDDNKCKKKLKIVQLLKSITNFFLGWMLYKVDKFEFGNPLPKEKGAFQKLTYADYCGGVLVSYPLL